MELPSKGFKHFYGSRYSLLNYLPESLHQYTVEKASVHFTRVSPALGIL